MYLHYSHIPFGFMGGSQRRTTAILRRWVIHLRSRKAKAFRGYRPSMQTLIGISQPCGLTSDRVRSISVGGGIQRGQRLLGRKNPKKPAVSWHTTLLARSSVLYLRPRLTGKRSVLLQECSFCLSGKRAGFCEWERAKHDRFQEWGQGYKAPAFSILSCLDLLSSRTFPGCRTAPSSPPRISLVPRRSFPISRFPP